MKVRSKRINKGQCKLKLWSHLGQCSLKLRPIVILPNADSDPYPIILNLIAHKSCTFILIGWRTLHSLPKVEYRSLMIYSEAKGVRSAKGPLWTTTLIHSLLQHQEIKYNSIITRILLEIIVADVHFANRRFMCSMAPNFIISQIWLFGLDKAPRLSISNSVFSIVIWILSSDTDTICQLNQFNTNSEAAMLSSTVGEEGEDEFNIWD